MSSVTAARIGNAPENIKRVRIPPPSERQRLFLQDRHRYVAFGGARGGGKSWAVRVKAVLLAGRYPGIKIMIVRRTYPELRANHINPLRELLGDSVVYKDSTKEISFPNGSVIMFRHCQDSSAVDRYQGTEVDVLCLDEATQLTEEEYDRFKACVRGVNDFPKRVYLTCNPGGVGHSFVKRLFVDRAYRDTEDPAEYSFIRSLVTDNRALMESDPTYVKQLEALPPKLRKAWLEGDWNIFEGQFFEEFAPVPLALKCAEAGISTEQALRERRWTHVIEPFKIPREWQIYRSFDFGYARPFSCDWWAIDFDGRAYLFRQFYGCTETPNEGVKKDPDWIFSQIRELETSLPELRGREIIGVADPSIWDRSRGEAIVEAADRHFVSFMRGDNRRLPGWMQCHYRLRFDEEGLPMVYFFNTCRAAIRTLPLLQYDEHKPEDLDTTQEDHFADSFRYFCMARSIAPVKEAEKTPYGDDPLDLYGQLY